MSFGPKLRARVRLRCDDDWDCEETPLWREVLVAIAPVALTGYLEWKLRELKAKAKRKEAKRAARAAEESFPAIEWEVDEEEAPSEPAPKKRRGSVH